MIEQSEKRVDTKKLSVDDFVLRGEFRIVEASYHDWRFRPEFKKEGSDSYVPLDELFSIDRFDSCYAFIVQTPDSSKVVRSGYLHKDQKGDVSFGVKSIAGERVYHSSLPVWLDLLDDAQKPIVEGPAEFIFVEVSPWHNERDARLERVLK